MLKAKPGKKAQAMTLPVIKQLWDLGKLDPSPDYQRESVWTRSQRQLLIDSLLRDFDIPKIYFRSVDRHPVEYEIVDGQQRIRSIVEFLEDGFPLSRDADSLDGDEIKNRSYKELQTAVVLRLNMTQIDTVILTDYSDEHVREMFSRLQNGTSLNAAEKRHAFTGGMNEVVRDLARHKMFFDICEFTNTRYAYEDLAAKMLHESLAGRIVDIRSPSIQKTYDENTGIDASHVAVKQAYRVANFLHKALKQRTVRLKKYSLVSLFIVVSDLIKQYNLSAHSAEFGLWYEDFEARRIANKELDESDTLWNSELAEYTDNARNDSIAALTYRDQVLRQSILSTIVSLEALDATRAFSAEERFLIYLRDGKHCKLCNMALLTLEDMHADHIKPHSLGGATSLSNGQALCSSCNLKKAATSISFASALPAR